MGAKAKHRMQHQVETRERASLRNVAAVAAAFLAVGALATDIENGHFRGASGLPGSLFPIGVDGTIDFSGASAVSAPIAYTPGGGTRSIAFAGLSSDSRFRLPFRSELSGSSEDTVNGHLWSLVGFDLASSRLAVSLALTEISLPDVYSMQYLVPTSIANTQFAIGVQDVLALAGANPRQENRSFYAAATRRFGFAHATVGIGTHRFEKGFLALSGPLGGYCNGVVEYDGLGWNVAVSVEIGSNSVLQIGYVDFDRAYLAAGMKF